MRLRIFALVFALLALVVSGVAVAEEDLTNWALGKSYTYSMAPHENYPDEGGQLTDGVYAQLPKYHDQAWVGHLRNDFRTITVDLGEVRPIQEIRANFMQEMSAGIYYPVEVMAEVSADGVLWTEVGLQRFNPFLMGTEDFIKPVIFDELDENARYVRITFLVDVWVFIDEIEVLGK